MSAEVRTVADRMTETGLSEPELAFVQIMNKAADLQETWAKHCAEYAAMAVIRKCTVQDMYNHGQTRTQCISAIENILLQAGTTLGTRPRFSVSVDSKDEIVILPRNGAAARLLKRYEILYTQRELGRE